MVGTLFSKLVYRSLALEYHTQTIPQEHAFQQALQEVKFKNHWHSIKTLNLEKKDMVLSQGFNILSSPGPITLKALVFSFVT